jgi:MFS family permease
MISPALSPVPDQKTELPPGAWLIVGLLWFAGCSNYLTRTMLTTMRGSIMEEIPMTDAQFGLLTSAFLWIYAFVSPFAGYLADRFRRRSVIIASIFAWSFITWLTSYAKTFEQLLALRALLGLAEACYIPAAMALITDFHRGPTRSLATGIHMTGLVFGSTIGGLGGWIAENHSWSYAYTVIGVPNIAFSLVLVFFLKEGPREVFVPPASSVPGTKVSLKEGLSMLAGNGAFYFVISCWCLQGAVGWMIIGWMPTHMREQFSMGQGAAGFSALGYVYVTQAIGLIIGGLWSDRWSLTNQRARVIIPAMGFFLAAPAFWMTGYSNIVEITILSLILWGLAEGFLGANMMPIICLTVDPRYRATALGVLNCFTAICGGLSIYGVGALRDAKVGVSLILTFAGVGVVLCAVFLVLVNLALKKRFAVSPLVQATPAAV